MLRKIYRQILGRSFFKRMYLLYTIVIVVAISLLGILMAGNISRLRLDQTLNYNRQQLTSLQTAYKQQLSTLAFIKEKIYAVQTGNSMSIYDAIKLILKDDSPFISFNEYTAYVNQADYIYTFLNLVQSSLQVEMSLFMISGAGSNSGNMNIIWPITNQGMLEQANDIKSLIKADKLSKENAISVMTLKTQTGINRNYYILYDTVYDSDKPQETIGYIINGYAARGLNTILDSFSYPLVGTAAILASDGTVIYDSSDRATGQAFEAFQVFAGQDQGTFRSKGIVYNVVRDPTYDFYVVGVLNAGALNRSTTASNLSILLMAVLGIAVVAVLTGFMTRRALIRVRDITAVMSVAETGQLDVRARTTPNQDEFDKIAGSLNTMIHKIDEHIHAVYVSEIKRQHAEVKQWEAELYALQAQIDPHFLYNMLETIRMKALMNGDADTSLLIKMLANLFRNRIKGDTVVSIRSELNYCSALIEILSARFNGEINVLLDVDPSIEDFGIVKDLIQPLVENAFMHGFKHNAADDGEHNLILHGEQQGELIELSLYNNGSPISPEKLQDLEHYLQNPDEAKIERRQIGLINVHQRIRLVYGEPCGLKISSCEAGTTVRLLIKAMSVEALKQSFSSHSRPQLPVSGGG